MCLALRGGFQIFSDILMIKFSELIPTKTRFHRMAEKNLRVSALTSIPLIRMLMNPDKINEIRTCLCSESLSGWGEFCPCVQEESSAPAWDDWG